MLEKTLAPLQFRGGIDTKTDEKAVTPGKLLVLENATFENPGRLNKRFGYAPLSRDVENPRTGVPAKLGNGRGLVSYKDELLTFDGRNLYSRSESSNSWLWKGVMPSCSVSESAVSNSTQSATAPDGAIHRLGMQAFVWLDSTGVRYTIIDAKTGQRVVASALLASGDCRLPKVVVLNNDFLFYYQADTGDLKLGKLSVADPTEPVVFDTIITYSTDSVDSVKLKGPTAEHGDVYDVRAMSGGVYIAFINTENETSDPVKGGITTKRYSVTDPTLLLGSGYISDVSGETRRAVGVFEDLYLKAPVVVESYNTSPADGFSRYHAYASANPTLGVLHSAVTNTAQAPNHNKKGFVSVSGVSTSDTSRELWIFSTAVGQDNVAPGSADTTNVVRARVFGDSFLVSPISTLFQNCVVVAKPVRVGGTAHFAIMNANARVSNKTRPFDRSVFVVDAEGTVVAKFTPSADRGDGLEYRGATSKLVIDPEGAVVFPYLVPPQTDGSTLVNDASLGVLAGRVQPTTMLAGSSQVSDSIHFGGGILWQYDGISPVELGFLTPANPPELTVNNKGVNKQAYIVVPEWTDAQGFRHLGTPSTPTVAEVSNGETPNTIVRVATLTVTMKRQNAPVPRSPILLGIYRTTANGEVYHLVTKLENSTTALVPLFYTDTMSDSTLVGQPTIYTEGGTIENGSPPATDHIVTHNNRLFAVDAADKLLLHYSKQVGPGVPVEFPDDFTLPIDPTGGGVTAISSMDDKLVVFKRSSIFALSGQGPDDLGQMNDFAGAVLVTTDSGCVNARSIVTTPQGIIFQSAKGFRLLSRDLTVTDIGADVYGYKDDRVTGGVLCENVSQVRLTLDSGKALVFDYEAQQWSVFTPVPATASALWKGVFCYQRADGTVFVEDKSRHDDDGSFIRMRLKTAWMQFAQMQGFQRVYKMLVLGSFKNPHKLLVKLAYDFNPTPVQTVEVEPSSVSAYGADPFGAGDFGGQFPLYQWRVNPARQKCQAMQVTVEDAIEPTNGAGASMSLTGITFEVGLKRGTNKLGAGNTAR